MAYCNNVYLWRQIFVASGSFTHSAAVSFIHIFPSILNSDILSPNATDIKATADQASWIAASNGFTSTFGYVLHSIVMERYGRRMDFIVLGVMLILGWVSFLFARSVTTLIIARTIQGFCGGGLFIGALILSEYVHPTRRGYFTSIKRCSSALGNLICHSLAFFCTWRQFAAIAMVPAVISLLITCFWPEAPPYLALKGRYEECEKSFVWLNGNSEQSQMELQELISAQKERQEKQSDKSLFAKIKNRSFLKALLLVSILSIVIDACGKYYFIAYVIQIMTEITGDKSIAVYVSLGGDILSIIALAASSYIIRKFKRRALLFVVGGFAVLLMFSIGLIKLLKSNVATWLIPCALLLHYFVINISIVPVCYTLFGELFPLESRAIGCCFAGIVLGTLYAVTMKITPMLMIYTGIQGTYGTYGSCILICFCVLYFILPETKDKTLQRIENELCGIKRDLVETNPFLSESNKLQRAENDPKSDKKSDEIKPILLDNKDV